MPPSETSKYRNELAQFCLGYGIDLGYGGDPITPSAITVDLPTPYTQVGQQPLNLRGDARNLSWFTDNSLDYVYSSHLLEDFDNTEEVLQEWARVIKKGGRLVLLLPDQKRYEAYCAEAGSEPNPAHKIKEFGLAYVKKCLATIPYLKIIYERDNFDDYCFLIVAEKTDDIIIDKDRVNLINLIESNDIELQQKDQKIADLEHILTDLVASRSWRITRPLRQLGDIFRNVPKLIAEWQINGWNGVILALKGYVKKEKGERYGDYPRSNDYTEQLVTIAILTKNRLDLIKPCIDSIEQNLSEKYQVEILIGDTGSTEPQVQSFYKEVDTKYSNIKVINYSYYSFSHNYNKLITKNAQGQFLILLNNDTIVKAHWIDTLIDPLADKRIGLVGGKLLYPDETIQHAGIEFSENGLGIHTHKKKPKDFPEANYKAYVPAITFACAAMRHDVFDRFQLSEDFKEEAQDTDFCLRLAEAGFKVLYNPDAEIYHLECSSRDWRKGSRDRMLLQKKWRQKIQELAAQGKQRARFLENEYQNSITIMRDDGIGDLLMGLSAFKKMKEQHPEKKLILVTYQRNIEMMAGFKIFDAFIPIPNGQKYAPVPLPRDAQIYNFINLEMVFGPVMAFPKEDNKIHRHLIYSRKLGLDSGFESVPMPEYPAAKEKVIKLFQELKINPNQRFVVLNLLATNPARSWWEPYYPKLIAAIEGMGFIPLVVGVETSAYFKGSRLINLVNKTKTITEYIEAVKLGEYVISTDTSAYHIAALSGIPFLAIFTGGVKAESRVKFYLKYEVVEPPADLVCHPCWDKGCMDLAVRWKKDPCRISITPEMVIDKFKKLVEKYPFDYA